MGKKRGKSPILYSLFNANSASDDDFSGRKSFNFQKMSIRAQISTFLIVSLVIVLFVSAIFFVMNSQLTLREKASQSVISELSLFPPEKFVSHCVQKEIVDLAKVTLSQGGVYDLSTQSNLSGRSFDFLSFRAHPYLFWSRVSGNQFISSDFVAQQLNEQLAQALVTCINLSLYGNQGYTVRAGNIRTNVTISSKSVDVVVYYPLSLQKGETTIERSLYSVSVDLPIGSMLSDAREIANGHMISQPLDTQVLMHQERNNWLSKPMVVIDKNTIYPHTLYTLELSYKEISIPFRFAIEGVDLFSKSSQSSQDISSLVSTNIQAQDVSSCISSNGECFDSVQYNLCVTNGGEFIQDKRCSVNNLVISDEMTQTLDKCIFSDGSSILSGSSWCATGTDGQPLIGVGSRHSRLLCVNGEVLQEPCQDYRQEVCAQTQQNGLIIAQCQPNSASICSQCTDKTCCESSPYLSSCTFTVQQACVPRVSQGIAFWKPGLNICQDQFMAGIASTQGKITSPNAQATLCAQYADCGATVSVIGETTQSQFDSDYYSRLISFWQQQAISYVSSKNNEILSGNSLPLGSKVNSEQSVSTTLGDALADIEQLAEYDTNDYLNPNVPFSLTTQVLNCQPYVAPNSPSCSYCELFDKACSEYVCRSLGTSCRAIPNISSSAGVTCVDSSSVDLDALRITSITNSRGDLLPETKIGAISGYFVSNPLSAHELLVVNLTTNRPARCKPTYLPYLSFMDVGSLDLSSGIYTTQHQLRIKFVNDLPVFDRMLANFAVPDYSKLVSALADFKLRLDQLRLKYGFVQKYNPTFYPYLNQVVEQYLSDKTRPTLLELMNGISHKQFAIFFVCQDEFGNELIQNSQSGNFAKSDSGSQASKLSSQNPFVQFTLQSSCMPVPPKILSVVADSNPYVRQSVTAFIDKFGSCKFDIDSYDYDSMRYNMSCATSEYDLSSEFDGSYACVADLSTLSRDISQIYVSCSDSHASELINRTFDLNYEPNILNTTAKVVVNISNLSTSSISFSSNATIWTGLRYRCSVEPVLGGNQQNSSSENSLTASAYSLSCTSDSCIVRVNNKTLNLSKESVSEPQSESLVCIPRVPKSSCVFDEVHNSAPLAVPLVRLPSLVFEDASIVGREFVVTVKSRGTLIDCTLTTEQGKTYSLSRKTNQTFVMSSSILSDNSLVKISCADGYGLAPQFISLVKK